MSVLIDIPKKIGKSIICRILERQVVRLRRLHQFKVVAVVGSMGKTSTKTALAQTLSMSQRVIWQQGNYNDRVTVPLVLFSEDLVGLFNIWAWIGILYRNWRVLHRGDYPYDVAVVELGTDGPGQIAKFAYLKPDILLVTAISPEHMEYFKTLDAVATEELSAAAFSKQTVANIDDIPAKYLQGIAKPITTYGFNKQATYKADSRQEQGIEGQILQVTFKDNHKARFHTSMIGVQGAKITLAAATAAHLLGLDHDQIQQGLQHIEAFAGRMRILAGVKNSVLIDDSYNAAPATVQAALDVLYRTEAAQRIAILGSMNELGDYTVEAHKEVGAYCDPRKLDLVVTIGRAAADYLAPEAEARGCRVKVFNSPYAAGEYVKKHIKPNAVVLGKGSQNGVFAEEALKMLLADPADAQKMVRQSSYWLKSKARQFPKD